ncbi:TIGR02757 family protein [Sulfurospirillum sp. T05]|uniref:TIGR02757 family protein n=2 Tax=Sulfurospirillum tamanense TaxID=2813362 RepID=A0ABS2WT15_9BACT|nr:TIGR02757 family protein [Sulfurospirillum tamanensis]
MKMKTTLKTRLDKEAQKRNVASELLPTASPDPMWIAKQHKDEFSALVCALFAYGNARAIVNFLAQFPFEALHVKSEAEFGAFEWKPYRFQTAKDVEAFTLGLWRLKQNHSLNALFLEGYNAHQNVAEGVRILVDMLHESVPHVSRGLAFLLGKPFTCKPKSPLKRWMLYLRWMVRKDAIDLGLWKGVAPRDLLMPLDTHTFKVAHSLGLLKRKSYDFRAAEELTENLRVFDFDDPVKYDFALFRLGQERGI